MATIVRTQRLWPLLALAAWVTCGSAGAQDGPALVIRAGKIIPVTGDPIAPGAILIRDGKIAEIGPDVDAPADARVIDVPDGVVIPGLVTAFTTLSEGTRDVEESVTPDLRVADGLDTYGDWRGVLSRGITTVYLSPAGRRLMPGQGAVAKLGAGPVSARVLDAPAPLRIVLGEWPKNPPRLWDPPLPPTPDEPSAPPEEQLPTTRMGEMVQLRRVFEEAESAAVAGAVRGDVPVRVRADRAEDIRNALALADEFGLQLTIEGGREAHLLADELARRDVAVVLFPEVGSGEDLALTQVSGEARADCAAVLSRAGVTVAIATEDASRTDILPVAAWQIGNGMPADAALRAITQSAAEIMGVEDQVGAIEVGRDADLAILTGEPFATRTRVQATISDGRVAYERKATDVGDAEAAGDLLIIRAARIFTGSGGAILSGEIRIRGSVIEDVGQQREPPPDAEVVDLGDRTVMPGMIDMQTHLGLHWETEGPTLSWSASRMPSTRQMRLSGRPCGRA